MYRILTVAREIFTLAPSSLFREGREVLAIGFALDAADRLLVLSAKGRE